MACSQIFSRKAVTKVRISGQIHAASSFMNANRQSMKARSSIKESLKADVLKAGHHGSKNSTSKGLLKKIKPEITVISCGKNNEYGHPNQEVLTLLKSMKSSIYRTDKHKTVIVVSDGRNLTVSTDNKSIKKAS